MIGICQILVTVLQSKVIGYPLTSESGNFIDSDVLNRYWILDWEVKIRGQWPVCQIKLVSLKLIIHFHHYKLNDPVCLRSKLPYFKYLKQEFKI